MLIKIIILLLISVIVVGCTQNKIIMIPNLLIPAYIFPYTNETIVLAGAGEWVNVTFAQEVTDIKEMITHTHNDTTNDTFIINIDGIYDLSFNFDLIDTSVGASDVDIAGRAIFGNSSEITGSVFETDLTKQQIETELSHKFLAKLREGDEVVFQFTATDSNVELSTHGTFGDHPESASIVIKRIANIK